MRWSWLLAGSAAAAAVGAWWLLRARRAGADCNSQKTIGRLLAGIAVLMSVGFAYLQFTRQLEPPREPLRASVQPIDIYALAGAIRTSNENYRPALDALCAFIRDVTETKTSDEPPTGDIEAALSAIGMRASFGGVVPNLTNARIPYASLVGANLNEANLRTTNLRGVNLVNASLDGADLSGADLSRSNLSDTSLSRANLTGANLGAAFLLSANLSRATLTRANLSDASMGSADLTNTNLSNANLSGIFLVDADLSDAELAGANLFSANLSRTNLSRTNLSGADLSHAKGLTQAQLDDACGTDVKGFDQLSPPLTIKPCPPSSPK